MGIQDRREREKQQRKKTIVDAAHRVIEEEGLEGLSMDKIAERAELSKGALYLYFKSKEDLIIELIKLHVEQLLEMIEKINETSEEFEDLLRRRIKATVDFFNKHMEFFNITFSMLPKTGNEFKETVHSYIREIHMIDEKRTVEIFSKFDLEKFRYPPLQMYIAMYGLVTGFLMKKLVGVYDPDIDPDLISDIFLGGVLK